MFNDLFLTFEQQVYTSYDRHKKRDLRAHKNDKPDAPEQKIETYSNGYGDTATQNGFNPSDFNKSQMNYYQSALPTLQNKMYDFNGQDTQARAEADALKQQGLRRFTQDTNDIFGQLQADNANRFGSLDNSTYDTGLKRFAQATQQGLQDLNNQYDANYQNNLNNIQAYNQNNLNSALNGMNNLYNLANGQSANALNSSNATNQFNQNNYNAQMQNYMNQQKINAALWGNIANATGTAAGAWLGGKPNTGNTKISLSDTSDFA